MTLSARPLLGTASDLDLFTGRANESARIVRALRTGLNCIVVGDPGAGKTSLVRMALAEQHRASPGLVEATVWAAPDTTAAALLQAVSAELTRARLPTGEPAEPAGADDPYAAISRIRQQVSAAPSVVVILIEDVPAVAGIELFGSLRDELWTIDARWLVTVSSAQAPGLLRPPADVFFEVQIDLAPLTDQDAAGLLRKRIDLPDDALVRRIVESAGGNPRRLIELARDLDPRTAPDVLDGYRARDVALAALGRPAQLLARELDALGGASASDRALLDRMAWTRARIVQVLGELEDSGLVTHRSESSGRGRPRKVYRLVPADDFALRSRAARGTDG